MPTPHIEANKEDIAPLVLMPGDPRRAKYIASKYLTDYKLVNEVREEHAYTGFYKNKKVTIFSSGMGIPSMGIYSYELFNNYNVEAIIRIGTAGSYVENLKLKDLVLVNSAYSTSSYGEINERVIEPSFELNYIILSTAKELNIKLTNTNVHTTEEFYTSNIDINDLVNNKKCYCTEMECYSLFINAKKFNKKASSILTISDSLINKNSELSSFEREKSLDDMIILALESIIKI